MVIPNHYLLSFYTPNIEVSPTLILLFQIPQIFVYTYLKEHLKNQISHKSKRFLSLSSCKKYSLIAII